MTAGMFDPLPDGSDAAPPQPTAAEWRVIMPVPDDAPAPPAKHPKLGASVRRWEYRDAAGRLLFLVCRHEGKGGEKEIRPLVFAEHRRRGKQWRWHGFPKPRPLYGLDRLAARPDAPVIVTEGEKAVDAAGELLSDHVAITSPGGSKAARAADWSALAGRRVTIWPDADEPGQAYAGDVCAMLATLSPAPVVTIVKPPAGVAEGWDAADALAEGWTAAHAGVLIAAAAPSADPAAGSRPRKPASRGVVLDFIDDAEIELWHDQEAEAYATVPVNGHREHHAIASRGFRGWLIWRAYEETGSAPAAEAIECAVRVAEALALNRGPCHRAWRRVAEHDGRLYLDLCDPQWRAVEISAGGWRVVGSAEVPAKFLRSRGTEPLPEPDDGALIEELRGFVNVETDADFRLVLAWLAAGFRPNGPYPILVLTGQQGASKTTLARICRRLIDPNMSPIRAIPKEERDLAVSAFNSWTLIYDNLSGLPAWFSDALCRLSTGGGFATRQLHSDRDEVIFAATRPIVLTGIGDLATRADFADRSLAITQPPLAEDQRREEREFWTAFEEARPRILGALCSAVAAGLRRLPDVKLDRRPRMADFATWAEACAPGFGWEPGQFLRDYEENNSDAVAVAAEASPLLPVIEAVLGRTGLGAAGFDGTATELLARLREVCSQDDQKSRWFPGGASQLGSALRRIAPLLRSRGINFAPYKAGHNHERRIVLRCRTPEIFNALVERMQGWATP